MIIRRLHQEDLNKILLIEQSVHVAPWAKATFELCLKSNSGAWVAVQAEKIVGFIIVSFSLDECHVLNIAVSHAHQHQGIGRQLLEAAIQSAIEKKMAIIYLEVRRSNARAIALYRRAGFEIIGERKDYYALETGHEDALIFAKVLTPLNSIDKIHQNH